MAGASPRIYFLFVFEPLEAEVICKEVGTPVFIRLAASPPRMKKVCCCFFRHFDEVNLFVLLGSACEIKGGTEGVRPPRLICKTP